MCSQGSNAGWAAAVAHDYLGPVVADTACDLVITGPPRGRPGPEQTVPDDLDSHDRRGKGWLFVGEWAAMFVPQHLLKLEFDPATPALVHLSYAGFRDVTLTARWRMPTATVRFSDRIALIGPRRQMVLMHTLWTEDARFGESTKELWA
jgi:hypothetical protein